MPQKRSNQEPPPVMTWGKAAPALVVGALFDALRLLFEMFWFFGPALAALYCTVKGGGGAIVAALCGTTAAAVGTVGVSAITAFGVIMAMAVGLFGWLVIGLYLMRTNSRIFKENALWFIGSLALSEMPLIGAVPAFTLTLWKMYSNQIRIEKAAFKKYEEEQKAAELKEQKQQAQLQYQSAEQAQFIQGQQAEMEDLSEEIPDASDTRSPARPSVPQTSFKEIVAEESLTQEPEGGPPRGYFKQTAAARPQRLPTEAMRREKIAEGDNHEHPLPIAPDSKVSESHLSVQEDTKKYNAYFVHMFQITDTLDVSENNKSLDTKKLSGTDKMDILYGVNPTLSASTVRPDTTDRTFQGAFGVIIGKGTIESAAPSDDGTIATSFESRHVFGGNKDKKGDVERAINRSKDSNGYNEVVVKQPSISGSFMKLQDDDRISYEEESIDYGNFGGIKTRRVGVLDMSDIMFGKRVEVSYAAPFNTLLAMKKRGQGGQMFLLNNKNEMLHVTNIDEKTRRITFDTVPVTPEDMVTHFSNGEVATNTKREMMDRLKEQGILNK
ncbi:MAG: hypothetical protein WC217_01425 [Candidatus Paceibacterota bacterium]|jgi:hypothetical protein